MGSEQDQTAPVAGVENPVLRYMSEALTILGQTLQDIATADEMPGSRMWLATVDRILTDVWASRPQLEAYGLGRRLAYHAGDHMLGIGTCVQAPRVLYSIPTLVRASVESAARAVYLLDPSIDERERVRRWINERLDSLMEEYRLASGIGTEAGSVAGEGRISEARKICRAASARGFDVDRGDLAPDKRGWISTPQLLPRRPSAQAAISLMEGAGMTGPTMHRLTSGVIHGADHGLMSFMVRDETRKSSAPGMSLVPVGLSGAKLAIWLAPTIQASTSVALLVLQTNGRQRAEWDNVAQPILRQWRDWMRSTQVRGRS